MDDTAGQLQALQASVARLDGELVRAHQERERLGQALRQTRGLAIGALLLGVLAPFAARWLPITFRSVRARELIVQDHDGQPRITLSAADDSAAIIMRATAGKLALELKSDVNQNLLALYSRSEKPSTGIRLSSWKNSSGLTLHHQEPAEGAPLLTGYMALESNFQGSAQMTLHAADNGHIKLEGSGIREIGPAIGLWPGDRKDKPSSWLSIESLGGRPAISLISSDGPRARLDLNSGPALTLEGPFGNASSSASLAIRPYDKGPSLLMSAPGSSLMLSTGGAGARVSVVNGLEDGDSWSTPLPAKKK